MVERVRNPSSGTVRIAVVGKYTELVDAYKSVQQALIHGGIANDVKVKIEWMSSESYEAGALKHHFEGFDGLLIPGGFGDRGIEGMLMAIEWARENGLPFFGICLGLQCAIIEFAQTVCGRTGANSVEFDPNTADPVICLMDSQAAGHDQGRDHAAGRVRRLTSRRISGGGGVCRP